MAVHFNTFPGVEFVDRRLWNEMAAEAAPMMEWEYYYALEQSGSVSIDRGYRPCHLMAYENGRAIALAPLYERDRAWVEFGDGGLLQFLTELTGLPFHQGLVATIPLTPVPAYEFLPRPGEDRLRISNMILDYIDYLCETRGLSTSRLYFMAPQSAQISPLLIERGYVGLKSQYFLWFNREYKTYDDYLATFKSSRRTKIKRELRTIREQGIKLEMLSGEDVPPDVFSDIYELYTRTWIKHMGLEILPFLQGEFFSILEQEFRHRIRFCTASGRDGQKLAMAIFYEKGRDIYGRYWGCFEDVPFLHFATCYYHPIAYAIEKGLSTMDPGFGGNHKLLRGYEVVPVYHFIKFFGERQKQVAATFLQRMETLAHVPELR